MTDASTRSRLYVLDTNVLLHDPQCLFRFAEHDVYIPFVTLEELDNKKQGTADINRNARQATRTIAEVASQNGDMSQGFPLQPFNGKKATGRLFLQDQMLGPPPVGSAQKADNQHLAVLEHLQKGARHAEVILVTKDLNLRIKARSLKFLAEDYLNDQVIEDAELLTRGWRADDTFLDDPTCESGTDDTGHWYRLAQKTPACGLNEMILCHEVAYLIKHAGENRITLRPALDYRYRNPVFGIHARNEEQNLALNHLMDPEIDFVSLLGPAGTGKTLLTLAAALEQTMEEGVFEEVIFTRATVPLGEDIGFLPGTEEEKMAPWMGALFDNLELLTGGKKRAGKDDRPSSEELGITLAWLNRYVKVKAMTFMRGRTFNRKFLIIDEAQNLTPKQMKALITRAGEGSKVVCMGNLAQIDTPYLSEANSGLTYAAERFKGWAHYGQVILSQGERSRLASYANLHL